MESELDILLENLKKKKIPYRISVRDLKVIKLDTDNQELIKLAKQNNPNLN